jgi:hypothetical protein
MFYYPMVFCAVYPDNTVGLVYGVIWGGILNFGQVFIIQPILLLILRPMLRSCRLPGLEMLFSLCSL